MRRALIFVADRGEVRELRFQKVVELPTGCKAGVRNTETIQILVDSHSWDMIGHQLKDFSLDNEELDPDDFTDEMKMVFAYPKETYMENPRKSTS